MATAPTPQYTFTEKKRVRKNFGTRKSILEGCDEQVHVRYKNRYGRTRSYYADFEGVMAFRQKRPAQFKGE